jgi:hypothetical protein
MWPCLGMRGPIVEIVSAMPNGLCLNLGTRTSFSL